MNEGRCGQCRFWDQREGTIGDIATGVCRRRAPAPITILIDEHNEHDVRLEQWPIWPQTLDYEWCGEFQVREES